MKKVIGFLLAVSLVSSGCAFTWGASQLGESKLPFGENARSENVPLPGVLESLTVVVYFAGRPVVQQYSSATSSQPPTPAPLSLEQTDLVVDCDLVQWGQEKVYRATTRYGKSWKYATATMFFLESALAALVLLDDSANEGNKVGGALLAADALGTAILFFVPSRAVYNNSVKQVNTPIRNDCPEGLTIELAGRQVAVAANGKLREFSAVLVKEHMESSNAPIRVALGQNGQDIFLSGADRCYWAERTQHPDIARMCSQSVGQPRRTSALVSLSVPLGSLIGPGPTNAVE